MILLTNNKVKLNNFMVKLCINTLKTTLEDTNIQVERNDLFQIENITPSIANYENFTPSIAKYSLTVLTTRKLQLSRDLPPWIL